jgi:hypothetical protein
VEVSHRGATRTATAPKKCASDTRALWGRQRQSSARAGTPGSRQSATVQSNGGKPDHSWLSRLSEIQGAVNAAEVGLLRARAEREKAIVNDTRAGLWCRQCRQRVSCGAISQRLRPPTSWVQLAAIQSAAGLLLRSACQPVLLVTVQANGDPNRRCSPCFRTRQTVLSNCYVGAYGSSEGARPKVESRRPLTV